MTYKVSSGTLNLCSLTPEVMFADRTTRLSIGRVKTVQLLTHETPEVIGAILWPANSPDLGPVDYWLLRSCRSVCTSAGFMTSPNWSRIWVGTFQTRWSADRRWSSQAVTFTSSSLYLSTLRIFWTQTLNMFDFYLTVTCLSVANSGHFMNALTSLNLL